MIFSSPVMSATLAGADAGDDLVVDLAREQPERQPDNADVMREHALDGEMGLAGIGRPEHGGDAAPALRDLWNAGRKTGSSLTSSTSIACENSERGGNESRPNR